MNGNRRNGRRTCVRALPAAIIASVILQGCSGYGTSEYEQYQQTYQNFADMISALQVARQKEVHKASGESMPLAGASDFPVRKLRMRSSIRCW